MLWALENVIWRKGGGGVGRDMFLLHQQPPVTGPPTHLELFYDLVGRYRENGKKALPTQGPRTQRGGREGTEDVQGAMARVGPLGPPSLLQMNNKYKTW